jgi:hypothetical protein
MRRATWRHAALIVSLAVAGAQAPMSLLGAAEEPSFVAPVEGPVVDGWRPPATPYGPGNRGLDFATTEGEPVRASADGEVTFAGQVGGSLHVVVLHPGGLRTSYSFLATVAVRRGDDVRRGDIVGTAASSVHFGVRVGDDYVDPTALLSRTIEVHLVPDNLRRPRSAFEEMRGLLAGIPGLAAHAAGVAWAQGESVRADIESAVEAIGMLKAWAGAQVDRLVLLGELASYYAPTNVGRAVEVVDATMRFRAGQRHCTPRTVRAPRLRQRHIAVLVGGFSSTSTDSAVGDLDTRALGYADRDVAVFSYAGGQAPGRRHLPGVDARRYGVADSEGDLRVAAVQLRALLALVRYRNPGVPVDLIGFSQGGVVARAAVAGTDPTDPRQPKVANLIAIGSPFHGANLATGAVAMRLSTTGSLISRAVAAGRPEPAASVAVGQLRHNSPFVREVAARPLDAGTRFTSIAAAGDLVVPALNSATDDGVDVLLPGRPSPSTHRWLPGRRAVRREVGLALAGMGPTCRGVWGSAAQAAVIGWTEDAQLGGLAAGELLVDRVAGGLVPHPPSTRTPGPVAR